MPARCLVFICVLTVLFPFLTPVSGEIPELTSYQGKVTDLSGNPVADGSYSMRFRIYNVSTGGSPLWDSGIQTVSVAGGVFSILLGESPQPALELAFDEDYWLLVTFDGINQTPRQRLTSIGYAYMASGLVPGTVVSGSEGQISLSVVNTRVSGDATALHGEVVDGSGGIRIGVYGKGYYGIYGNGDDSGGYFVAPEDNGTGVRGDGKRGVHGDSHATDGLGVLGRSWAATGDAKGVEGASYSVSGTGVYGWAQPSSGTTRGVHGKSNSVEGMGVHGEATATTGTTYGVYGESASTTGGTGVYGKGYYGVYGDGDSTLGVGGWFVGAEGLRSYGNSRGVLGEADATTGVGVLGQSYVTTGETHGVSGWVNSVSGIGVYGYAYPSSGSTRGVHGESRSTEGTGVHGEVTATTGITYGVYGLCSSTTGRGVYGHAIATSGECFGGRFETGSTSGRGVFAHAYSGSGTTYGVYGRSDSPSGRGVYGEAPYNGVYGLASGSSGINYGVFGKSYSTSGYGGYFEGDVHVFGSLSKSSGSFLIDHPLDPENKLLRHNFMESPENLVVYRGKAELDEYGEAVVEMPEYFGALTKEDAATVNLTPIGKGPFDSSYEWNKGYSEFTIYGEPEREIAWTVYAERDDPTMRRLWRPVEEDKGPDNKYCDRGRLLDPVAYGYPESMGRNYEEHERERVRMEEE